MRDIEKYYGVHLNKRAPVSRILKRSTRQKTRQKAERLLREVNTLYISGNYHQCFSLLEEVVRLTPRDFRAFYLLGLVHEELHNPGKAHTSYFVSALLRKNDPSLWRKVLASSASVNDDKGRAVALEKLYRREPSRELLNEKTECFRRLNKKYWVVCCDIERFDYDGVDMGIFDRFKGTRHVTSLRRIVGCLVRAINKNEDARTEEFVRKTLLTAYKAKEWRALRTLYDSQYSRMVGEPTLEMSAMLLQADIRILIEQEARQEERERERIRKRAEYIESAVGEEDKSFLMGLAVPEMGDGTAEEIWGLYETAAGARESDDVTDDVTDEASSGFGMNTSYTPGTSMSNASSGLGINTPALIQDGLESMVESASAWESLQDGQCLFDLAVLVHASVSAPLAIRLLRRLVDWAPRTSSTSRRYRVRLAEMWAGLNELREAIRLYTSVLEDDPMSMHVKASLHSLYLRVGESELAAELEASTLAYRHAEEEAESCKSKYRYSESKCGEMREMYEEARRVMADGGDVSQVSGGLLEDFFSNAFVVLKNKNFKKMRGRHERLSGTGGLLLGESVVSGKVAGSDSEGAGHKEPNSERAGHKEPNSKRVIGPDSKRVIGPDSERTIGPNNERTIDPNNTRPTDPDNTRTAYKEQNTDITTDRNRTKESPSQPTRALVDKHILVSSLHGLDVDEWFGLVAHVISAHIHAGRLSGARELVLKSLDAFVFRDPRYSIPISLLGFKTAILLSDHSLAISAFRHWPHTLNYSAFSFLFFLCFLLPGLFMHPDFAILQRNLQRHARYRLQASGEPQEADDGECIRMELTTGVLSEQARISGVLLLSSYTPRFLSLHTVDSVVGSVVAALGAIGNTSPVSGLGGASVRRGTSVRRAASALEDVSVLESSSALPNPSVLRTETGPRGSTSTTPVSIMAAAISIGHSRSRVATDRVRYAKSAISILESIQPDTLVKQYNLAKAYHFTGQYARAEKHYLAVLDSESGGHEAVRTLALFNLSLIYRKTRSRAMLQDLLVRYSGGR